MVYEEIGSRRSWLFLKDCHVVLTLSFLLEVVVAIHSVHQRTHGRGFVLGLEGRAVVEVVLTFIEDFSVDWHLRHNVHWVRQVLSLWYGVIFLFLEPNFDWNVASVQEGLPAQDSDGQQG